MKEANLAISVVSHGQGRLAAALLSDLRPLFGDAQVIVTLNKPEPEDFLRGLPVTVIRNAQPKGFGANHNQAFNAARCARFAVLNPDVRCGPPVFDPLLAALDNGAVGISAPLVLSPAGAIEDSARRYPTFSRIGRRLVRRCRGQPNPADYPGAASGGDISVEWVAGMFMVFDSRAYREVGGFDERYFMYLEDADICRRMHGAGWDVRLVPQASVVHDARRASTRDWSHLRWHLSSMARFLMRSAN